MISKINTNKDQEKHLKTYTTLEIKAPIAHKDFFKDYVISYKETPKSCFYICKHSNLSNIKTVYKDLIHNFEVEVCDLTRLSAPDYVYLIVFQLLNPGLKRSDKYRYVGIIETAGDVIAFAWIHPFLRGKGLFTSFLEHYAINENILAIQPPLSKTMIHVMEKFNKDCINNSFLLSRQHFFYKKHLKRYYDNNIIDDLTFDEISNIKDGLTISGMYESLNEIPKSKLVEIQVKTILKLRDPEFKREIQDYFKQNPRDIEYMKKDYNNYLMFGQLIKE